MPANRNKGYVLGSLGKKNLPHQGRYACVAAGNREVTFDVCSSVSRTLEKNLRACATCTCPWRLCRVCIEQGELGEDAWVVDKEKGFCKFHLAHGPDFRRSVDGVPERISSTISNQVGHRRVLPTIEHERPVAVRPRPSSSQTNISFEDYLSAIER